VPERARAPWTDPSRTKDLQTALQRVIVDVLDEHGGRPEPFVHGQLRSRLRRAGLPLPPDTWLLAVAGEIAADRLYVTANDAVPPDYAARPSGRRAAERIEGPGRRPGDQSPDAVGST
jgi:hypothetical protein